MSDAEKCKCGHSMLTGNDWAELLALRAEVDVWKGRAKDYKSERDYARKMEMVENAGNAEACRQLLAVQARADAAEAEVERGCWMWDGTRHGEGYGMTANSKFAHRVVYEALVGPIPEGLELDHLCRNTGCVRPEHLEPVTRKENILRGESPQAKNARKTRCPKGHPLDYAEKRGRGCKTCRREVNRRLRASGHKSPSDLTRNERRRRG